MRTLRALLGIVAILLSLFFGIDALILLNQPDLVRSLSFAVISVVIGFFALRWLRR